MPRVPRPWFRVYVEIASDPKIRRLTPTQRWLWIAILAAARQSPSPGELLVGSTVPMNDQDLASFASVRIQDVRRSMPALEQLGMIHREAVTSKWIVTSWRERQYESDDVTARAAKSRALQRSNNVATEDFATLQPDTLQRRNGVFATPPDQSRTEQSRDLRSSDQNKAEPDTVATPAVVISVVDDNGRMIDDEGSENSKSSNDVFAAALSILVEREAEIQTARGNPPRTPLWADKTTAERKRKHWLRAAELIAERPEITPRQLAIALEPPPHPSNPADRARGIRIQNLRNSLAGLRYEDPPDFDAIRDLEDQLERELLGLLGET